MASPDHVKYRVLPGRHGMAWLMQGMLLLRSQAARLLMLAVLLQIIMGLTQLPLVGLLIIVSVPALSAGMLQAFHTAATGGAPPLSVLFLPLASRGHVGRFLMLGVLLLIIGVVTVSLVMSGSAEAIDRELLARIENGDLDAVAELDPSTLQRLVLAFVVGISVSGTLSYFSVPLIWFHGLKVGPALALGVKALVANWKPFIALGFMLVILLIPVAIAAGILLGLASTPGGFSIIMVGLVMIMMLAIQLIIFGTQYCAVRDVFGVGSEQEPPGEESEDNQFVA